MWQNWGLFRIRFYLQIYIWTTIEAIQTQFNYKYICIWVTLGAIQKHILNTNICMISEQHWGLFKHILFINISYLDMTRGYSKIHFS